MDDGRLESLAVEAARKVRAASEMAKQRLQCRDVRSAFRVVRDAALSAVASLGTAVDEELQHAPRGSLFRMQVTVFMDRIAADVGLIEDGLTSAAHLEQIAQRIARFGRETAHLSREPAPFAATLT